MSLAKSLPSQCASRAASALRGQRPLPQVCRNKRLDTVQTPGGNVVSLQGSMILASRGFSVIFPQGLTNSMASVVILAQRLKLSPFYPPWGIAFARIFDYSD